jgi:hypothetical protein
MASSLFSTLKASRIVFIFDVTNNFCTHGGYELVTASITSSSDIGGCSDVPNTAYSKRCEAILPSVDIDGRIILKYIIQEEGGKLWTGLVLLTVGSGC